MLRTIPLMILATLFLAAPALADCTSPAGAESQTRYDFTAHKLYYCDGTSWVESGGTAGGGGSSGPADCPIPGNTCADGSKYAGTLFGWHYFATASDDHASRTHSQANTLCDNLSRHGKDDWELPNRVVLGMLYENRNEIGGFVAMASHQGYWSKGSIVIRFFDGSEPGSTGNFSVRCVRKQ